eukprot:1072506-Pelagomonas_calceolata.AAC.1
MDSINHIALRCLKPTINGMHTDRHHDGLSFCVKAVSNGRYGWSLIGMDACRKERLLEQGIEVPEKKPRTIPDWVFANGTGSSARHHSRPNAVFCTLSQDDLPTLILLRSSSRQGLHVEI